MVTSIEHMYAAISSIKLLGLIGCSLYSPFVCFSAYRTYYSIKEAKGNLLKERPLFHIFILAYTIFELIYFGILWGENDISAVSFFFNEMALFSNLLAYSVSLVFFSNLLEIESFYSTTLRIIIAVTLALYFLCLSIWLSFICKFHHLKTKPPFYNYSVPLFTLYELLLLDLFNFIIFYFLRLASPSMRW